MMSRLSLAALLLICLMGTAQADDADEGTQYNGSFIGVGLLAGPHFPEAGRLEDVGWVAGAYVRYATVVQVIDTQLEYHVAGGEMVHNDRYPLSLSRHTVSLSVNLHPLFQRLITNNYFWWVATSAYLQLGASIEITSVDGAEPEHNPAFGLHWGLGFDMPLGDPQGTGAFWLGFNWRWKFTYHRWVAPGRFIDPDAHVLLAVLSYRFNNTSFTRIKRPPELKFRE